MGSNRAENVILIAVGTTKDFISLEAPQFHICFYFFKYYSVLGAGDSLTRPLTLEK